MQKSKVSLSKEDEDFTCNEMEHKDKHRTTSTQLRPNEAIINLFILQHIEEEATNDKEHQVEDEEEKQIVDSTLKEKLPPMIHDD